MSPRARRLAGRLALVLSGAFAVALLANAPADAEFGYDVDAYIGAARGVMARPSPKAVPVEDAAGKVVGMISEQD